MLAEETLLGGLKTKVSKSKGKSYQTQFTRAPEMNEQRSFDLKYKLFETAHYLKKLPVASGKESCSSTSSYFQYLFWKNTTIQNKINQYLQKEYTRLAEPDNEINKCLESKSAPYSFALSIRSLFASDNYISLKTDWTKASKNINDLRGSSRNFKVVGRELKNLTYTDLFKKKIASLCLD